jgi:hypothetical protein
MEQGAGLCAHHCGHGGQIGTRLILSLKPWSAKTSDSFTDFL